jgi:hypothetical protein
MNELPTHCVNLNIRYHLPDIIWSKVVTIYQMMPGWKEFDKHGIPYWFGTDESDKFVSASVEPSGLQISAKMESQEWNEWITKFKEVASDKLGFAVGEPEDGFE